MTQQLLDGAEMAILINRIEGIARKMTNTLYRALRRVKSRSRLFLLHRNERLRFARNR